MLRKKQAQNTPYRVIIWLRYIASALICFVFIFALLCSPGQASLGISSGIDICIKTLIPALFPFMFVSSLMVQSGLHQRLGVIFGRLTYRLFRQPACTSGVILMSLIGGFPVGARMTAQVHSRGEITKKQARRLCLFCVNPGPAFVVNAVGGMMLGSYKAGALMYAAVTVSALLCGVLTGFLDRDGMESELPKPLGEPTPLVVSLTRAADSSARSMLSVCVWVTVFTCVLSLFEQTRLNSLTKTAIAAALEVTSGCKSAAGQLSIPVIAGIIGWGGLSTHCQVLSSVTKIGVDLRLFFTARVLCGAFSALICYWLLVLFPVNRDVFTLPTGATWDFFSVSAPVSVGLLFMCALLLVGEGARVRGQ